MSSMEMTKARFKLLKAVSQGEKGTKNLYWLIESNWHTTNYHLRKMVELGWLQKKVMEKRPVYAITDSGIAVLQEYEVKQ